MMKCSSELNCGRDWSSLPDNVLSDISSRLTFSDFRSFGYICKSWRSAKGTLCPQLPFYLHSLQEKIQSDYYVLQDLPNGSSYRIFMPQLRGRCCIGSQDGWLIIVDFKASVMSLYDPFTMREIDLFSGASLVQNYVGDPFSSSPIRKVVLPSIPNSSSDPLPVVVSMFCNAYGCLAYKRVCEDSWTIFGADVADIVYWRGQFIALKNDQSVWRLDLNELKLMFLAPRPNYEASIWSIHLVELDGNLLQVWRTFCSSSNNTDSDTFRVMQLDEEQSSWVTIDNLHGHSLFLDARYSVCFSPWQIPGLKDDLIYFFANSVRRNSSLRRQCPVGVFNMRNRTVQSCPLPSYKLSANVCPIWFVPKTSVLQDRLSMLQDVSN